MKKPLVVTIIVAITICSSLLWVWWRFAQTYAGKGILLGLDATAEVLYDNHGVPHIYASSMEDAH